MSSSSLDDEAADAINRMEGMGEHPSREGESDDDDVAEAAFLLLCIVVGW